MDLLFEANRLAGELANDLRKTLFREAEQPQEKRTIVAYSGHFQPFHEAHFKIYKVLVSKFGRDNVYITTTNETDEFENPLSFDDKKSIITKMFNIEEGKFQEVENPFVPKELLKKFSPKSTSFVTVVTTEDAAALSKSKYFQHYNEAESLKPYAQAGYYLTVPELRGEVGSQSLTGQQIMQVLGSPKTKPEMKEKLFTALYGKSDADTLELISSRAKAGASDVDGEFKKTKAHGNTKTSKPGKTDADGQDTSTDDEDGDDKTPPMQRMITNPDTGREIKVQSALKYPRWKPVYKRAEKVLKSAGVDRKDRVKEPEVNARYKARAKSMKKEDLVAYLGDTLSEQLHAQFLQEGVTLTVPGLGEVLLRLTEGVRSTTLLTEAAPNSHIQHPYDDINMSFKELKGLVSNALTGELDSATEKTDGQNILFTVKDGKVMFARNTQHTKNHAANAMDAQGFKDFFAKHGEQVSDSFGKAAFDVEAAVERLPDDMKKKVFNNGSRFAMAEILNSELANTIPYNTNVIMLLSVRDYDEKTGNPTTLDKDAADMLADTMAKLGVDKQSTYKITGKNKLQFSTSDADRANAAKYLDSITKLEQQYGLTDDDTIGDFLTRQWSAIIDKQKVWSPEEKQQMIRRFITGDKSFGVRTIQDPKKKALFSELDKQSKDLQSKFIRPVKSIILNVGADALNRATNLIGQNDGTREKLKAKFKDAVDAIKNSGQAEYIEKTKNQLEQLKDVGVDKISPAEGIVFTHNGQLYKFTGAFAPVNQIVGINTYKLNPASRGAGDDMDADSGTDSPAPEKKSAGQSPVVVYPGRFQPFHAGHYSVYKDLVDKYGKDNVFIGTSDKTDNVKSPFNFNEKQTIMSKMFNIPTDKIVQVKSPYSPQEILSKFPENTPFITAFSEKDAERLGSGSKYFKPLPKQSEKLGNYRDTGYFTIAPEFQLDVDGQNISGTTVRAVLGDKNRSDQDKKKIFTAMYGKFDPQIFDLVTKKLATVGSEPPKAPKKTAKVEPKKVAKKADPKIMAKGKGSVLNKKIRNPETDNDILVKTALKYDKKHPAYKAAAKMVRSEALIVEGGNAVSTNSKIPNKFAQSTADYMASQLGLDKLDRALVGSTFKPILNDLDVAMDLDDMKKVIGYNGTDKKEFFTQLKSYLDKTGIEVSVQPGFQQFSIAAPLVDEKGRPQKAIGDDGQPTSEDGRIQLDFMMGDLPFMKRILTNGSESKVSSTYRNVFLANILGNISEDTDTPGVKKRYLMNMRDGIYEETFTEKANGKRETITKNKVSNDVDFLAKAMFGEDAQFADIDTFEKLARRVTQPDVKFRDKLPEIIGQFKDTITKMKKELPAGIPDTSDPADIKDNGPLNVYLDDLRPMPQGFDINPKTAQDAINLLKTGRVKFISFDHDLGPEEAGTGYDVAKWIEQAGYEDDNFVVPEWQLHSANPVGRKNIEQAMRSAERSPGGQREFGKSVAPAEPATKQTAKAPEKKVSTGFDPKILNTKIKNPETNNDILVKTALKYDKTHPAYKAAEKVVRNSKK